MLDSGRRGQRSGKRGKSKKRERKKKKARWDQTDKGKVNIYIYIRGKEKV